MTIHTIWQIYGIRIGKADLYKLAVANPSSELMITINHLIRKDVDFEKFIRDLDSDEELDHETLDIDCNLSSDLSNNIFDNYVIKEITHDVTDDEPGINNNDFIIGIVTMTIELDETVVTEPIPVNFAMPFSTLSADVTHGTTSFKENFLNEFPSYGSSVECNHYMVQDDCTCCS